MGIRRRLTALAVGLALTAPVAVATAAPSSAIDNYAKLRISPSAAHPGYYDVIVYGHFNGAPEQSLTNIRLHGDDPLFDNYLGVTRSGTAYYGDFSTYALVWGGTLNEDWDGCDEVFATVQTSTGFRKTTNTVSGCY